MAVSELDVSPGLPLWEIHRALVRRAIREQQVAQATFFLRGRGLTGRRIREQLGVDGDLYGRGQALLFLAQEAVESSGLVDGGDRACEMALGRLVTKMREISTERVSLAERIVRLRAEGYGAGESRDRLGVTLREFQLADRWLMEAGVELRDR